MPYLHKFVVRWICMNVKSSENQRTRHGNKRVRLCFVHYVNLNLDARGYGKSCLQIILYSTQLLSRIWSWKSTHTRVWDSSHKIWIARGQILKILKDNTERLPSDVPCVPFWRCDLFDGSAINTSIQKEINRNHKTVKPNWSSSIREKLTKT